MIDITLTSFSMMIHHTHTNKHKLNLVRDDGTAFQSSNRSDQHDHECAKESRLYICPERKKERKKNLESFCIFLYGSTFAGLFLSYATTASTRHSDERKRRKTIKIKKARQ